MKRVKLSRQYFLVSTLSAKPVLKKVYTMKSLLVVALCLAGTAGAATVYRDRTIPAAPPCLIPFDGNNVNMTMVQEVNVGFRPLTVWVDGWPFDHWVNKPPYPSLRITLITGVSYEIKAGDLKAQEAALLKLVKDTCK
jgi:hypothetical protein